MLDRLGLTVCMKCQCHTQSMAFLMLMLIFSGSLQNYQKNLKKALLTDNTIMLWNDGYVGWLAEGTTRGLLVRFCSDSDTCWLLQSLARS